MGSLMSLAAETSRSQQDPAGPSRTQQDPAGPSRTQQDPAGPSRTQRSGYIMHPYKHPSRVFLQTRFLSSFDHGTAPS
ncbi:mCG1029384 [Mus musculus]|nr:mCG1029384 [Mus musculus]